MATINPDAVQGAALYADPSDLPALDDRLDRRESGVIVEESTECSATGFAKVLDLLRHLVTLVKTALLDVNLTGLADGDMLVWNATATEWQPAALPADKYVALDSGDTTPGYLSDKIDNATIIANEGGTIQVGTIDWTAVDKTYADPSDIGAAAASHEHAATDITSGRLDVLQANLESPVALTGNPTLDADAHGCTYYNATSTRKDPTLPAAAAGLRIRFMVLHADGIKITAAAGDRIRFGNDVTTADTGYIQSGANNGHVIELVAVDATNWVAVSAVGTWAVTAS